MLKLTVLQEGKMHKTSVCLCTSLQVYMQSVTDLYFLNPYALLLRRKELCSTPYLPPSSQLILKAETAL